MTSKRLGPLWTVWSLQRSDCSGLEVGQGTKAEMTGSAARRNATAARLNMTGAVFVALPAGRQPSWDDIPPLLEAEPGPEPAAPVPAARRSLGQVTADAVTIAVAGTTGRIRDDVTDKTAGLVAEAYDLGSADAAALGRKSLARAWSACLDLMMSVKLPEAGGKSLLQDVLDLEPDLRERFAAFLNGETSD